MGDLIHRHPPWHPEGAAVHTLSADQTIDWSLKLIGVEEANKQTRGDGIVLGIIDSGVDETHPDLQGQILSVDNFSRSPTPDRLGHGTAVAYCALGVDDNTGGRGVAPGAKARVYKALGDDGSGNGRNIAAAIDRAVEDKCDVLVNSYGAPFEDPIITRAALNAIEAGVVFVVAAGNAGPKNTSPDYPAAVPPAIAVASINERGEISRFSSRGSYVDYAAPGENVLCAQPGGRWQRMSGTSFACPFLAGVIALILSAFKAKSMTVGLDKLNEILKAASVDPDEAGHSPDSGWGIVHADKLKLNGNGGVVPTPGSPWEQLLEQLRPLLCELLGCHR